VSARPAGRILIWSFRSPKRPSKTTPTLETVVPGSQFLALNAAGLCSVVAPRLG